MPFPSASQAAVSGSSAPMSAMYASELGSTGSPSMRVFQGLSGGKMETFVGGGGGGDGGGAGVGGGGVGAGAGSPAMGPPSAPSGIRPGNGSPASRPSGPARSIGPAAGGVVASKSETPPLHAARASRRQLRVRIGRGPYPVTREARGVAEGAGQCVTPRHASRPEGGPARERPVRALRTTEAPLSAPR